MKRILLSAILLSSAVIVAPAHAQSFTYATQDNESDSVQVGTVSPDGHPIMATYTTGTSNVTWPDGKKTVDKYTCISTSQPPHNTIFAAHTICDATGEAGTYTATFGCNFLDEKGVESACVGGLYGKTGMYKGKGGMITFHGKGAGGDGTGQWNQ